MKPVSTARKRKFFLPNEIHFPSTFSFGACSAAWQVENGVSPSNWSLFENQKKPNGSPCAPPHLKACEAIEHFDIDLNIMKTLKLSQYRFGVSWSALNPKQDQFNDSYMQNYINQVKKLRASGIEPIVTLWHFELPAWLEEQGGLISPSFVLHFMKFVRYVVTNLKDDVKIWLTVNEPVLYALFSYGFGEFPPGKTNEFSNFFKALVNLMTAHSEAYHYIHSIDDTMKVSFPKHIIPFVPVHRWSAIECIISAIANQFNTCVYNAMETGVLEFKLWFITFFSQKMPQIIHSQDFIAVNHYQIDFISINPLDWVSLSKPIITSLPRIYDQSDFDWPLITDSLANSMEWVNEFYNPRHLPMIVTEHGLSDQKDTKRERYVVDSLGNLSQKIQSGVPVVGYLHWALTDNYEWASGYTQHFGLTEINYKTQKRTIRNSAKIYAQIANSGHELVL